jgi:hypothetical protein
MRIESRGRQWPAPGGGAMKLALWRLYLTVVLH